ncbi:aminoacetone oxidase family FAD-binding enzyme [bacterium]|nr:aminoacetone oxidase family FAD-binding enzyme [bacterium]
MERYDVMILGAGAAGMMAAIEAGRRGRRVLIVDHARAAGEKIRISGGGRCNFTNLGMGVERFLSKNPRFALSALKRFTARDFLARVEAAGIAWHEKTLGQLFCDGSAKEIVAMLLADMARAGVTLWLGCSLGEVRRAGAGFEVETARGPVAAGRVILATGGKSIPKMGATGYGYRVAESFGLALTETRPALVPLTFAEQELAWMAPLAGVALPVRARAAQGPAFDEALLFTHRGLSGPSVLQISSYWREGQGVRLDLCPGLDVAAALRRAKAAQGRQSVASALAGLMPERLARVLAQETGHGDTMLAPLAHAAIDRIARHLQDWNLTPVGSEGYRTAEVTLGGVDTDALDARTMEAKSVPGLHFVGEVVDVTGWLGGYNFQWAWSSGWAAGQAD